MNKIFIAFYFLFFNLYSQAQNSMQDICQAVVESTLNKFDTIKIISGQMVCLNTCGDYGKLVITKLLKSCSSITNGNNSLAVATAEQSDQTSICADFNLITEPDGTKTSVLILNNPLEGVLHYRAKIYFTNTRRYEEVQVGYLLNGISSIETWPVELPDIILYDFRLER